MICTVFHTLRTFLDDFHLALDKLVWLRCCLLALNVKSHTRGSDLVKIDLQRTARRISRNWGLYLLLLPSFILLLIFAYKPMYGVIIAFKNYKNALGIVGSPWSVPLFKNFTRFFSSFSSKTTILNTVWISLYSMLAGFPFPIMLALMINSDAEMYQAFDICYDYDIYDDLIDYVQGKTTLADYAAAGELLSPQLCQAALSGKSRPAAHGLFVSRPHRAHELAGVDVLLEGHGAFVQRSGVGKYPPPRFV